MHCHGGSPFVDVTVELVNWSYLSLFWSQPSLTNMQTSQCQVVSGYWRLVTISNSNVRAFDQSISGIWWTSEEMWSFGQIKPSIVIMGVPMIPLPFLVMKQSMTFGRTLFIDIPIAFMRFLWTWKAFDTQRTDWSTSWASPNIPTWGSPNQNLGSPIKLMDEYITPISSDKDGMNGYCWKWFVRTLLHKYHMVITSTLNEQLYHI